MRLFTWLLLTHSSSFFLLLSPSLCDPRVTQAGIECGNAAGIVIGNVIPNFVSVMREISDDVKRKGWGYASIVSPLPELFALSQCHGDLFDTDCLLCFAASRSKIPRCLQNARFYLDGCFLRYDSYDFSNETIDPKHDMLSCGPGNQSTAALTDSRATAEFSTKVDRVLRNVLASAVENKGFAIGGENGGGGRGGGGGVIAGVYALAQCWSTLDVDGCRVCLQNATAKVRSCAPDVEGRAMNAGCFVRYSSQKFFNVPVHGGSSKVGMIVAIASSTAATTLLILIGAYFGYKKYTKKKLARESLMRLPVTMRKSHLSFQYETLEKATNFFDESRKLGQGGASSVYKGILPDGKVVAVKRLVFNTSQWVDDFFNEVNLINGIKHENLVGLLGCSIEGPESLLVYEYVPNRSLDQVLFADKPSHIITWEERHSIIEGIAKGLAYLHGGYGTRIIHRDIKTSNILLDENLTVKIADFGLVRYVAPDKSHISTGIAGTLGYMAPEYIVRGRLTEKVDIYAFGILVLEILTGRKNSVFAQGSGSVLHTVWKNYKSNTLATCVDPALRGKVPVMEASKVLQIGLLCTQASAELRPPMSDVVAMLDDKGCVVPAPKQPPFLNASVLSEESSRSSAHTSTLGCLTNSYHPIFSSSLTGSQHSDSR